MDIKFLVVDDSVTMRRIVTNSLKTLGYSNFVEAVDGQDAISKIEADSSINFVITDWNMPNMTGLELTQAIRGNPATENMQILMVTTRGVKDDILQALQAKVNKYVVKPFTPKVLKEKLDQIISKL